MLADDLIAALDPVKFATDHLMFEPDPWQKDVLLKSDRRIILNCSRQSGKSTIASVMALHRILFYPDSLVLLVSPSLRQSAELFRKVRDFSNVLSPKPKLVEDNKLSLQMKNGSRVVSLPGEEANVRGYSNVSVIIEDEASRVSDDLYRALRPMLAVSGGRMILMSTPFGKRGHFFEEWEKGSDWVRFSIPASDCPRISQEFLDQELNSIGEWWYQQEYGCQFVETENQFFSHDEIMRAMDDEIKPLQLF